MQKLQQDQKLRRSENEFEKHFSHSQSFFFEFFFVQHRRALSRRFIQCSKADQFGPRFADKSLCPQRTSKIPRKGVKRVLLNECDFCGTFVVPVVVLVFIDVA